MAGNVPPGKFNRHAAEDRSQEIAEEVAKDEEHDRPGGVSEFVVHAEETEVEEEDREFVTEQSDQIDVGGCPIPLMRRVSTFRTSVWTFVPWCNGSGSPAICPQCANRSHSLFLEF